jgi:hypothetical protein
MSVRATARKCRVIACHLAAGRCPLCRRWLVPEDGSTRWGYRCAPCVLAWSVSGTLTMKGHIGWALLSRHGRVGAGMRIDPAHWDAAWGEVCRSFAPVVLEIRRQTRIDPFTPKEPSL